MTKKIFIIFDKREIRKKKTFLYLTSR